MTKLGEVTRITAKPGKRAEVMRALADHVEYLRDNEPGTEIAIFHEAVDDDVTVCIYVLFADEAAREVHRTPHAARTALGEVLAPLTDGAPVQQVFTVASGKIPSGRP